MTADELSVVLRSSTYNNFSSEKELQEQIQLVLTRAGASFHREVDLTQRKDIIDFLVAPRLGVEVKIRETLTKVTRQLHRYAQSPLLDVLLFVSTSRQLCAQIPRELNGKRVVPIAIGGV